MTELSNKSFYVPPSFLFASLFLVRADAISYKTALAGLVFALAVGLVVLVINEPSYYIHMLKLFGMEPKSYTKQASDAAGKLWDAVCEWWNADDGMGL